MHTYQRLMPVSCVYLHAVPQVLFILPVLSQQRPGTVGFIILHPFFQWLGCQGTKMSKKLDMHLFWTLAHYTMWKCTHVLFLVPWGSIKNEWCTNVLMPVTSVNVYCSNTRITTTQQCEWALRAHLHLCGVLSHTVHIKSTYSINLWMIFLTHQ